MDNFFDFMELRSDERPLRELKVYGLDIETTGLDHRANEIIEVGIASYDLGTGVMEPLYRSFVKPLQPLQHHITEITGITSDDLLTAPLIQEIAEEIAGLLSGSLVVAHNAEFDFSFLRKYLGADFTAAGDIAVLDTLKLSKYYIPSSRYGLAYLVEKLALGHERHHRAVDDALMCLRLFSYIIERNRGLLDENCQEITARINT